MDNTAYLKRYKTKKRTVAVIASISRYIFLIAFSYILLYPLVFMISHAFRDPIYYMDPTVEWVPKAISLQPLKDAMTNMAMFDSFYNSVIVEVVSAVISIISCGVAAYGIACFEIKGKKILNLFMVLTILVPSTMLLIPNYINFYNMGLLDTLGAFYLPAILGMGIKSGFYIFVYQQFYKGIPKELHEAAWIDGAGHLKTYVSVIVPSSGEALLTVSLLALIWHWNDFYNAQMYLSSMPTMAMKLNSYFSNLTAQQSTLADSAMAACMLFVLPMLIIYMLLQRKFVTSIAATGIVG